MHDDSLIVVTSSHLATLSSLVAFRLPEREHYGATLISPLLLKKHMTLMWMYVQHACTCVVNYVSIWVYTLHFCTRWAHVCWYSVYVCMTLAVCSRMCEPEGVSQCERMCVLAVHRLTSVRTCVSVCVCQEADDPIGGRVANWWGLVFPLA